MSFCNFCDNRRTLKCQDCFVRKDGNPSNFKPLKFLTEKKPKTNADRIRGKDDDGLADFFYNEVFLTPWCDMSCGDVEETPCRQCILKWLKQEADT